ncbi:DNA polymerase III subunit delta [Sphingomonas gilva]|uniref:DNA-directed DNA polymerase n=1 Tax=Sphingomonas gilva TaxID=2305907 RepID=A0A396RMS3_9SPHN|nr:DNA polymerase III subunit delta [Sphingomonas gilva]RHW17678.1 DNA polymerase III subunit delta [Sphingomonas gilva]
MILKEGQIERALDRPDPQVRLYLFYGPDEAGSAAQFERLARAMGPEAERIDIDAATLKSNPGRLAEEAASMGLFGEIRFVRVTASGDECAASIAELLEVPAAGNPVAILTGALRATAQSVKLVAASPLAIGHASYAPEGGKADALAAAIGRELGLRVDPEVAQRLIAGMGPDRLLLRRELEKLALYLDAAPDRPQTLDMAALDAVGADAGEADMNRLFAAVLDGRTDAVAGELQRLEEEGASMVMVLRQFGVHLVRLAGFRSQVDGGDSIERVTDTKAIFWKEKPAIQRQLRGWTSDRIATAIARTAAAQRAIMRADPIEAGAAAELLTIARAAGKRR